MESNQREFGQIMVKHHFFSPPVLVMATPALFSLLSLVHIILAMTIPTVFRGFFLVGVDGMTVLATGLAVFAAQRKFGFPIVVIFTLVPFC